MDTQRIILLLVFTFSLSMLWTEWQKAEQAKNPPPAQVAAQTASGAPVPTVTAPAGSPAVPAAAGAAATGPKVTVKTDVLEVEISAQGGDLVKASLLKHPATENKDKSFVLLHTDGQSTYTAQSGLIGDGLPSHKTLFEIQPGERELKDGQDAVQVRLTAPEANGLAVTKVLTFRRGSYLVDVAYELENRGANPVSPHAYFQLLRDGNPAAGDSKMVNTFTGPAVYTSGEKYQKISFEDIAKGKAKHAQKTDNGWVAMVQHYFVSAWVPKGTSEREFFTRKVGDNLYAAGVLLPVAALAPGAKGTVEAPLFVGPQEQDKLQAVAEGFDLVVDYGWLTVIAAPLFWVLQWCHKLVGNWGWAIILLTVLVKLLFFPLSAASYKSMAKMRTLTPRLMRLKEQFGDDKQRLNQAMMELYRNEKVNPLGGCLPILVQIPVFIALYWVLLGSVEMRHAPWVGWIQDLSVMDPYYVLPLIMGATMLIQTKLNPTPPDPIQAKVMWIMPIVFTGMFLFFPAGLVLYWTVNNLLSIAQQWQITRMIEAGGKAAND